MVVIILDMVHHILATLLLAMVMVMAMDIMDTESVKLTLRQRLMPMLSMALMEDMVLDTVLMVMEILATLLLAMAMDMDMESGMLMLMLNQSLMLSMEPMVSMAMDLDTVLTPWDMAMGMDMDIMVELSDTTNQTWYYNDQVPPQCTMVPIFSWFTSNIA